MKIREQIESIRRARQKMLSTLILLAVIILLTAAIITVSLLVGKDTDGGTVKEPLDLIEGEGEKNGNAVAYPSVSSSSVERITVNNGRLEQGGEFTFVRDALAGDDFLFTYTEDGEIKIFYPSVMSATGVDYSDLYAIESADGYNSITKIKYLTSALENPYFDQRIPLSSDSEERARQLETYGFGEKECVVVFDYTDASGLVKTHKLILGDKTVTGSGYYFMVDSRDYVYTSATAYFDYMLLGFYSFVSPVLITEGLVDDGLYGPITAPEFTHLVNTVHKEADGEGNMPTVEGGSTVVISASTLTPISPDDFASAPGSYADSKDGYKVTDFTDMTVELDTGADQNKIKKYLVGKEIGKRYDPTDPTASIHDALIFTIDLEFSSARSISFDSRLSVKYSYTVTEIEAVLTDGPDKTLPGTAVTPTDKLRVAYTYTVNGREATPITSHAVLDLTSPLLEDSARDALVAAGVGTLSTPVSFEINYTRENAECTEYRTAITEIVAIYDADGKPMAKITEETETVYYRYALILDGEVSEETTIASLTYSELSGENQLKIKEMLLGKSVGSGLELVFDEGKLYGELMRHFGTYVVSDIRFFVTGEETVSFSYLNYSVRDPFFGESIYKNNTDGYEYYGVNNLIADHILRLLGGLGENTSQAVGLVGTEVISVGITPDKLLEHGCYAHTVRLVLPRGVVTIDSGDENIPDDYAYAETLEATLFVSELKDDGTRVVGVSNYDIIVKVKNEYLYFVDETFVDFWARDNIVMTNVDHLLEVDVSLMMEDIKGDWRLIANHAEAYRLPDGTVQVGGTPPSSYSDSYNDLTVTVFESEGATETALTRLLATLGKDYATLDQLYKTTVPDEDRQNAYMPDTLGTTYFKQFMLGLFYVNQEGSVSEQEQQEIISAGKLLMRMSLKIDTDKDGYGNDEDFYTYEFYHFPDSERVLVRLFETDDGGNKIGEDEVSDFYISRLAFKRIAYTFVSLMNGVEFELGHTYPELPAMGASEDD